MGGVQRGPCYLFEIREYPLPIPLDVARLKLSATRLRPRVVVEARATVKELAVDDTAPANNLPGNDERRLVVYFGVRQGRERPPSWRAVRWRVGDPRPVLDLTILNDEDGF